MSRQEQQLYASIEANLEEGLDEATRLAEVGDQVERQLFGTPEQSEDERPLASGAGRAVAKAAPASASRPAPQATVSLPAPISIAPTLASSAEAVPESPPTEISPPAPEEPAAVASVTLWANFESHRQHPAFLVSASGAPGPHSLLLYNTSMQQSSHMT